MRRVPFAAAFLAVAACSDAASLPTATSATASMLPAAYTEMDLGPGFGEDVNGSGAVLINDAGTAYVWTAATGRVKLGDFIATGINARGDVSGSLTNGAGESRAALWTAAGGLEDAGSLALDAVNYPTFALDINDRGEMTGWTPVPPNDCLRVFHWTRAGGMTAVSDGFSGTCEELGIAINSYGAIVANVFTLDGSYESWVWRPARGWRAVAHGNDEERGDIASDINDGGDVVGFRTWFGLLDGPFLARGSGVVRKLRVDMGVDADARAINNKGMVIGYDFSIGAGYVWVPGATTSLGDGIPNAINDAGMIAGTSFASGAPRVALWVPAAGQPAAGTRAPSAARMPGPLPAASARECVAGGRRMPVPCAALVAR